MKIKHLASLTLLFVLNVALRAERLNLGFSWAMIAGKPTILNVQPYSPAATLLRVGEQLVNIDGFDTEGLQSEQVRQLLYSHGDKRFLRLRDNSGHIREALLSLQSLPDRAIEERELATLLAPLSPEDALWLRSRYPLRYGHSPTLSLRQFSSFAFAPSSPETEALDRSINALIRSALLAKGLQERPSGQADLSISTYYQADPTNATPSGSSWRYNPHSQRAEIIPSGTKRITFGIQIHRRGQAAPLWSCEAVDTLSASVSLEQYAQLMTQAMLLGYPNVPHSTPEIELSHLRYNYTGIILDREDLSNILLVLPHSPASLAGLRSGDKLLSINGLPLKEESLSELQERYLKLLSRLSHLRDKALPPLPNLYGEEASELWASILYPKLTEDISKSSRAMALSYVFAFRPFITPSGLQELSIELERSGQRHLVRFLPELRTESILTLIP